MTPRPFRLPTYPPGPGGACRVNLEPARGIVGAEVRTVMQGGEPWFVARDVALVLGYSNTAKALTYHCRAITNRYAIQDGLGRVQEMVIIPERDVYRLIMRSKLPAAEQFEEWVVGTVLPSLRKHGDYVVGQEVLSNEQVLAKAVLVAQSVIEEKQDVLGACPGNGRNSSTKRC